MATSLTLIRGVGNVGIRYGLEESVFLDSIIFWWRTNRGENKNFYDGRWWTYNSIKTYSEIFPWWTVSQIRRIAASCIKKGALLSANYNEDQRDRTMWYSPSDELLELYGEIESEKCICANQQMELPKSTRSFAETNEPLPCSYHEATMNTPPTPSEKGNGRKKPKGELDEEARELLNAYVGTDRELAAAMKDMIENRKELKSVNSKRAIRSLLAELDRLSYGSRENKITLLRRAVASGWKLVYPLKPGELPEPPPAESTAGQAPTGHVVEEEGVHYL